MLYSACVGYSISLLAFCISMMASTIASKYCSALYIIRAEPNHKDAWVDIRARPYQRKLLLKEAFSLIFPFFLFVFIFPFVWHFGSSPWPSPPQMLNGVFSNEKRLRTLPAAAFAPTPIPLAKLDEWCIFMCMYLNMIVGLGWIYPARKCCWALRLMLLLLMLLSRTYRRWVGWYENPLPSI